MLKITLMQSDIITVPDNRLSLTAIPMLVADDSAPVACCMHGFGHSAEHFFRLAEDLNTEGVNTVLFDMQSDHRGIISKNLIGTNDYLRGFSKLVDSFRCKTNRDIHCLLGHSNGGMIVQEWLQNHPDEKMSEVLLAPVPRNGLVTTVSNILCHHPDRFARFFKSFVSSKSMRTLTKGDVRDLFFYEDTPDEIISEARESLKHTSLRVFLEDTMRPLLRPKLKKENRPTLLVTSATDALFPPSNFADMPKVYGYLETATVSGGHDFFIQSSTETARYVADFLERNRN